MCDEPVRWAGSLAERMCLWRGELCWTAMQPCSAGASFSGDSVEAGSEQGAASCKGGIASLGSRPDEEAEATISLPVVVTCLM